eukprot:CCRYP_012159-RB/>CCRYP_012159-RB protein AED:0.37 eAED:0.37 QI:235/1/1/1/1/1/4/317/483
MHLKRAAKILVLFGGPATSAEKMLRRVHSVDKHNELTEDIEFWTRMTQAMSLPTSKKPTKRPTPPVINTPAPTVVDVFPTPFPVIIDVTPAPSLVAVVPTPIPTTVNETVPPTVNDTFLTPAPTNAAVVPTPAPMIVSTPVPTLIVTDIFPTPVPTPQASLPCGLTPEERATAFTDLALTVTPQETLNDPFSSQSLALQWIIEEDALDPPVCPNADDCKAIERYVMASFYFAAGGGKWDQCNAPTSNTPEAIQAANDACNRVVTPFPVNNPRIGAESTDAWLSPSDTCNWGGLACWGTQDTRNGCMDQLDFENDGLTGTLIPEMSNLDNLRFFILEQGNTTGTIPTEYGLFDRLLIFDMDFNDLSGEIPEEMYNLSLLQQLDLNDNNLGGTLSPNIGQLTTLTFIQLDHNSFSGTIPSQMGQLNALRIAFFNNNDFTGVMPQEVCANRNNTNPPGFLGTLVADCNPPNDPEVECSCCTSCNVD